MTVKEAAHWSDSPLHRPFVPWPTLGVALHFLLRGGAAAAFACIMAGSRGGEAAATCADPLYTQLPSASSTAFQERTCEEIHSIIMPDMQKFTLFSPVTTDCNDKMEIWFRTLGSRVRQVGVLLTPQEGNV